MNNIKVANDDFIQFFKEGIRTSSGEVALWRAVILQAVTDARIPPNSKVKYIKERDIAIRWLISKDYDFYAVCDLAELNSDFVEEIVDRVLEKVLLMDINSSIASNG
jgi:hypothetical protein